jgi:hypothetical protein
MPTGGAKKSFAQVSSHYVKKSIGSTDRTLQELQNGLFSLFLCGQKSGAKGIPRKVVL